MATAFPSRGQQASNYWDTQLKDYIDEHSPKRGTGNPNGVVSGGIGDEFINTESGGYNGARKWIKTTASGTSGWVVTDGDTGWRVLSAWDGSGVITSGAPINADSWAPYANRVGYIHIRRTAEMGAIRITNLAQTALLSFDAIEVPFGFRPSKGLAVSAANKLSPAAYLRVNEGGGMGVIGDSTLRTTSAVFAGNDPLYVNFDPQRDWPTALPGAL